MSTIVGDLMGTEKEVEVPYSAGETKVALELDIAGIASARDGRLPSDVMCIIRVKNEGPQAVVAKLMSVVGSIEKEESSATVDGNGGVQDFVPTYLLRYRLYIDASSASQGGTVRIAYRVIPLYY